VKYTLIREAEIPVTKAAELLGVSRSGYYRWRKLDGDNEDNMELRNLIQNIAIEFPAYGYRRITVELRNRGHKVNHKKVLRLMREDNLLCVKKTFKPITTDSNHRYRKYPNLVKDLEVNMINHVWAADITYIRLQREYVYLAVIIDIFSRKCVGWELSRNLDAQLTLSALKKALRNRKPEIHHSGCAVRIQGIC
jgi:transposase InsO family protein